MIIPKKLTPRDKKKLIDLVWQEVERFIKDWQDSPYEYSNEADVQFELASRIKNKCRRYGWDKVYAEYNKYCGIVKGYENLLCNRVTCEPKIYCIDNAGERKWTHADIIIFDDLPKPNEPPDVDARGRITRNNWHMLWVCEIKYIPEWSSKSISKKANRDLDKINSLLFKQRDGTDYACWLYIKREKTKVGNSIDKKILSHERLRRYCVTLPEIPEGGV